MIADQKEAIRDFYGTIVGFIETESRTGKAQARDFLGTILGTYDPNDGKNGRTRDFYGKILGEGNQLSRLIWDPMYNRYLKDKEKNKR